MRGVYREDPITLDDKQTAPPTLNAAGCLVVDVSGGAGSTSTDALLQSILDQLVIIAANTDPTP